MIRKLLRGIFSRENRLALVFAILLVLILMFALDTSPTWIYQGF
jgi:hypothetical protein